jgi:hypothetical protein
LRTARWFWRLAKTNIEFEPLALRASPVSANLRSVGDPVKYITDDRGERTAVVLPIADYEKLLEDLEDLAVLAERREEPTIPHEQFVSELKRDGLL